MNTARFGRASERAKPGLLEVGLARAFRRRHCLARGMYSTRPVARLPPCPPDSYYLATPPPPPPSPFAVNIDVNASVTYTRFFTAWHADCRCHKRQDSHAMGLHIELEAVYAVCNGDA